MSIPARPKHNALAPPVHAPPIHASATHLGADMDLSINGVCGTLEDAGPQIVLILHGVGGHRNYCYQKQLAQQLAHLGISSFRLDFRGCGESAHIDPSEGRSVGGTDFEDLNNVYEHLSQKYRVLAIVGHSRGASCMFLWALRTQHPIPFLINCSGRYHTWQYRERVYSEQPHYQRDRGYPLVARRFGRYTEQWISMKEVDEFCSWDSDAYAGVHPSTQVLTVFGAEDHHVPFSDSGAWANLFAGRHTLKVVLKADHNFFGKVDGKKVSYNPLVVEHICEYLVSPKNVLATASPRFFEIEGVENFRDFGCAPLAPGKLFRSARLDDITPRGAQQLRDLGIKRVFDLRSNAEAQDAPQIAGIERVHLPIFPDRDMSPEALVKRWSDPLRVNINILKAAGPAIERILQHVDEPLLIHCTAGKDRTGVVCAAILVRLGVDKLSAARDYQLTEVGWTKHRASLRAELVKTYPEEVVDGLLSAPCQRMLDTLEHLDSKL